MEQAVNTVNCVVCAQPYPAEDGLRAQQGRHFWTCSERCQGEFLGRGGMGWLLGQPQPAKAWEKGPSSGREPIKPRSDPGKGGQPQRTSSAAPEPHRDG